MTDARLGGMPRLHETGGSHAQRDLFEQAYIDALLRLEDNHQARAVLEKRAAARNTIPVIYRELALTYKKLGLAEEASRAARRAEELSTIVFQQ